MTWVIEGGTPKWHPGVIEILDDEGRARLRVTAPLAFTTGGRAIPVELGAEGARITLRVETNGEPVLVDPHWSSTAAMYRKRGGHVAARLLSGEVFVAGGWPWFDSVMGSELFDPATQTWSLRAPMPLHRDGAAAVTLADGRVLVAGGVASDSTLTVPKEALLYDPETDSWSLTPPMAKGRDTPAMTLLNDGRALVVGGKDLGNQSTGAAEIYDPVTGNWSNAGPMTQAYGQPTATLLPNGDVFVIGEGYYGFRGDIFRPSTGEWKATSSGVVAPSGHTATLLLDGTVLVAGGISSGFIKTVQTYDPVTNTWSTKANTAKKHDDGSAARLASGRVLLIGGQAGSEPWTATEIYDPATEAWSAGPPLANGRMIFPAVTLLDGRILVSGGWSNQPGGGVIKSAELFTDGSLGSGCGSSSDCESGFCADGVCCETACNAPCHGCSIAAGAPVNGTCAPVSGVLCEDGNACTTGDTCDAGTCLPGAPVVCAPDACHDPGTCDPAKGCVLPAKPDGTACDDGNACTLIDVCLAGVCSGNQPMMCPAPDTCHEGMCDPASGECHSQEKSDGSACDDENPCTVDDVCSAGLCGGNAVTCAASDACHEAVCDVSTGQCQSHAKPDGTECDDANVCTIGDTCHSGTCTGIALSCQAIDECHLVGMCDPVSGNCISPRAPDGTACALGVCMEGACVARADDAPDTDLSGRAPTCYCEAAGGRAGPSGYHVMAALLLGLVSAVRRGGRRGQARSRARHGGERAW